MDTEHIRAVLEVARRGSFTLAAQELYLAQSTVSRHVAAVERELGVQLFVRGQRPVEPTARGAAFLDAAAEILRAVERAERAVRGQ